MPRIRKAFRRTSGLRDAKLIVIATEGQKTEPKYFNALKKHNDFSNPRIHVEVLNKLTTDSSPTEIIRMLDNFKREYRLKNYDELWMVIDRDRQSWGVDEISEVAQLCFQKGYNLGLSNPCFELWLLLHVASIDNYSQDEHEEFLANKKVEGERTRLEYEIFRILGEYNKSNPKIELFLPGLESAITQAKKLDRHPERRWPNYLGTRVYLLVENMRNLNS